MRLRRWSLRVFIVFCILSGCLLGLCGKHLYLASRPTVTVLGRLAQGPKQTMAEPDDKEILRAMRKMKPSTSYLHSPDFKLKTVEKELVKAYSESERRLPLVGPAVLQHAVYRCTVIGACKGFPTVEVVFVDQNRFAFSR